MANIETITVGNTTYNVMGSGYSLSEEYSTTEKVVGTWISGKPVYQKTIVDTFSATSATTKIVSGITNNIDKIISIDGVVYYSDGTNDLYQSLITVNNAVTGEAKVWAGIEIANNRTLLILFYTNFELFLNKTCYVTVRYTKTTD